jgi:hypothetical protein
MRDVAHSANRAERSTLQRQQYSTPYLACLETHSHHERHNVSINQPKRNHPLYPPAQHPPCHRSTIQSRPTIPASPYPPTYAHASSNVQASNSSLSLFKTSTKSSSFSSTKVLHFALSAFGNPSEQTSDTTSTMFSSVGCRSAGRAWTHVEKTCLHVSHSRSRLWEDGDAVCNWRSARGVWTLLECELFRRWRRLTLR